MAEAQAEASAKAGGGLEESTYGHHARVESTRISRVLRGLDSYQPHEVNCGADGGHARPSGRVAWFARMIVRYHCLAFWGFLSLYVALAMVGVIVLVRVNGGYSSNSDYGACTRKGARDGGEGRSRGALTRSLRARRLGGERCAHRSAV